MIDLFEEEVGNLYDNPYIMMDIDEIFTKLRMWNEAYRNGEALVSDKEYDDLYDYAFSNYPENSFFIEVGGEELKDSRKSKLPTPMKSMTKIKNDDDLSYWVRTKGIDINETVILMPKYDGLSLCVSDSTLEAWTRGDGEYGNKSDGHFRLMINSETGLDMITYGEAIFAKTVFNDKYSMDFSNPRNFVGGLLNNDEPTDPLRETYYIRYGVANIRDFKHKSDIIDLLNKHQSIKVPYILIKVCDINEQLIIDLFKKWSDIFELDGIIVEVNSIDVQLDLGRERNGNPAYARAYKSAAFEEVGQTVVRNITYQVSKQGKLKPVLNIDPIKLDGVLVSNVTGNNAKFIKDNGIGVGSIITVKRSGMVIPKVVEVLTTVSFEMPVIDGVELIWDKSGTELITVGVTDEQRFMQIVSFFEILDVDNVSEGVLRQIWDAGYVSVKQILDMSEGDFRDIARFGDRKANIVYTNIHKKMENVSLSKLQHASGLFTNLGSRKLALLEHFESKPTFKELLKIDGYSHISANTYLDAYDEFFKFISELPITYVRKTKSDGDLNNMIFVFTGFRSTELEELIESRGGKVSTSVSKKTTYLITAEKGSGSGKEKKAIECGVTVFDVGELKSFLQV